MTRVTNEILLTKMEALMREQRGMMRRLFIERRDTKQLHVRFRQIAAADRDYNRELRRIAELPDVIRGELNELKADLRNMRRRYVRAVGGTEEVESLRPWWRFW